MIYDSAAGSYATASSTVGHYFGQTPVFTAVPSTTIAYNSIVNHNSPVFSTWADGNYNMDLVSPDFRGAIMLQLHPTPIWISTQPSNQVVTVGQPASLVVLAGDLPTLSYQWYINGSALAGATDNAYTVASAHPSDAGTYYVVVTNSYGSVFSSDAVLQVLPTNAPSIQVNGQLAVGTVLSANPAQVTMSGGFAGGFIFYTVDGTTPSTTSPLYSGPVVLSNSATVRAISLSGDFSQSAEAPPIMVSLVPSYDLQTSVVGGGVITITPLGSPYVSNSVVTLVATAAANWVFDHWAGDASGNQDPLRLRMNGPKTVQAIFAATAYPLTVSTPGGGAVTVDGLVVPPGSYYPTGTVVTLSAAPNSGWNFLGWQGDSTGTNNPLVLTINQTNNIQAIFGTEVTTSVVGSGSILLNPPNPVPFGVASATGIPDPGNYLRVWSGAANGTNNTTTFFVTNATPAVGALFVTVPPGTCTLNVMVNGPGTVSVDPQKPYYSLGETVTLTAVATNANASFNGWAGDTGGTANPLTLTLDTNRVVIANFGSTPSVMITPPTQTVLVGSNAVLNAIGAGLPPLSYQWLRDFAPVTGATNTAYTIYNAQPTDGGPYRVRISNPYGSATSAVATVTVVTPPSIANQPSSSTVTAGTPLQLIVGAVGTSPLSYQWFRGSGAVAGATDATYNLGPVQTNQAASYYAVVTNPYGTVTSSVATVTVYIPVSILVPPASQVVTGYSTVSFNVLAQGYPAPSYQWKFWGTNLPGAIFSTLTITNVRLTDLGDYSVFVDNGYSSQLSANATLRMSPTITAPFIGATAIWGRSAGLSVSAIGTAPLGYQWYKDGALIVSATNQTFLIQTVQLGDGGMYSVVVRSPFGSVTNTAQLVVNPANMDLGMYSGITITGASGYTYQIQYTVDLSVTNSWTTLTNLTLTQPAELWVDTSVDARTAAHRFYRILPVP